MRLAAVLVVVCLVGVAVVMNAKMKPPFQVGTATVSFDFSDAHPPRSTKAHFWYPAKVSGENAPMAKGRFPVLLYFPGWGGLVAHNASLLERLARHGFVVAGLDYPEGEGIPSDKIPMQFAPDSAYATATAQGNLMVRIEAENASRALDRLVQFDRSDPRFAGHLDTKRAGVLGYSLGGSVAAEAAWRDPRFRAVMNLDGWMFGDVASRFFPQPYLVFRDDLAAPTAADLASPDAFTRNFSRLRERDAKHQADQLAQSRGYRITIAGSSHFSFSDIAVANVNNAGPIDPKRAMAIVSAYAVDFFGKYLDGRVALLLDLRAAGFPEATQESFPLQP